MTSFCSKLEEVAKGAAFLLLVLFLTETSGRVTITRPSNSTITVSEGIRVDLECQHPLTEIVLWSLNGHNINNNSYDPRRFIIRQENSRIYGYAISRLMIEGINRTEAGLYKCSNSDLTKSLFEENQEDSIEVKVTKVNAEVRIEGPANHTVVYGKDLLLICTGDISSDLIWHFKGNLLLTDGHNDVTITTEVRKDRNYKRSALTVQEVTEEDEGSYHCYDRVHKIDSQLRIRVLATDNGMRIRPGSTLLSAIVMATALLTTASV